MKALKPSHLFLMGAMILASLTAYLAYTYLEDRAKQPAVPMKQVVQAVVDIPPRTIVTKEMIKLVYIPLSQQDLIVPDTAFQLNQVEGFVTLVGIKAREQVRLKDLAEKGKLSVLPIPAGKRAMTIAITETKSVAGAIFPGDHVDILCQIRNPNRNNLPEPVKLEDMLVVAIDKGKTDSTDGAANSLTLCTTQDEALALDAAEQAGPLRVILRPKGDPSISDDKRFSWAAFSKPVVVEVEKPKETPTTPAATTPAPEKPNEKHPLIIYSADKKEVY